MCYSSTKSVSSTSTTSTTATTTSTTTTRPKLFPAGCCYVHFQNAAKDDIVVCIKPDVWDKINNKNKAHLMPYGVIDGTFNPVDAMAHVKWHPNLTWWQRFRGSFKAHESKFMFPSVILGVAGVMALYANFYVQCSFGGFFPVRDENLALMTRNHLVARSLWLAGLGIAAFILSFLIEWCYFDNYTRRADEQANKKQHDA